VLARWTGHTLDAPELLEARVNNPLDAEGLRTRVQKALDDHLSMQAARLDELGPDLSSMVDVITDLLQGGKRLRAAFCYWGWRGAGGPDCTQIVEAAGALELFQAAALLHDDVMDDSDTRRGLPAAHRRLAAEHTARSWTGSAERFGLAGAILAGDLCLSWSDELFATSGLAPEELDRGRVVFDRMRTQLMGGQFLDVLESARGWADLDRSQRIAHARNVIRYKSAKYTVQHPLLIGATAAGIDEAALRCLSAYGLDLGEAFQLRDDILGVFGDPSQTGKPAGDDLREGKRTVLVAHALDLAGPAETVLFDKLLGLSDLDADGVSELRAVLQSTGALDRVEEMILDLTRSARAALHSTSGLDDEAVATLDALIDFSTSRSA
jgi:geranylgeranyl diphosphate synthase type I